MLKIYCDGGSRGNPGHAASAFLVFENEKIVHKDSRYIGKTTNNVAEYSAVVMAISWLEKHKSTDDDNVLIILDSELVAKQLSGIYKIKNIKLASLAMEIKKREKSITSKIKYKAVRREENQLADSLVNEELDNKISRP